MDAELSRIRQEVKNLQQDQKSQLEAEKLKVMESIQAQVGSYNMVNTFTALQNIPNVPLCYMSDHNIYPVGSVII